MSLDTTGGARERLLADPEDFTARLVAWLPGADGDELVGTRNHLIDINGYVKRHSTSSWLEALRTARLTEWEMARRWPVKATTGARGDDRPALSSALDKDAKLWYLVYAVGRADREWLLTETEPGGLTQAAVIKRVQRAENKQRHDSTLVTDLDSLDRTYSLIYADPPWRYEHDSGGDPTRGIEQHYQTMSLDDICALDVPSADDAVLFLWGTAPKLLEALQVMDAWGFEYRTHAVWVKDRIGLGYYFRGQHELLLVGKRGHLPAPDTDSRPSSVLDARRGAHSVKPQAARDLIEGMYPHASRLELFAREAAPGWDSWGVEAP